MKLRNWILSGVALVFAALLSVAPSQAAQMLLCAPDVSGGVQGSRVVVNTSSTTTPQPQYTLNATGCAIIAQADVGFFLSQGFTQASGDQTVLFTTGVWTGTTDFVIGNVPAGFMIKQLVYSNSTANAVTGGISLGTTANGVDIVAAQACAANCLTFTTDALTLKRVFSLTAATPIHAAPVTAGANSNVTITMIIGPF